MRKVLVAVLLAASVVASATARADDGEGGDSRTGGDKGTIGVGVIIGEPVGVCARLYLANDRAIQGAVGSAFLGGGLQLHADYVFHPYILQTRDSFVLATYVGPGARIIQYREGRGGDNFFAVGARAVGGLLFDFKNPLDAFVEVAAVFEYAFQEGEGAGISFNAGAGVRYYF